MNYRQAIKHIASGGLFVNVYEVQQVLGGSEEGGWYYDEGTALESHPVNNEKEAYKLSDELEKKYNKRDENRKPFGSVNLVDPGAEIPEDYEPVSQAEDESYVSYEGEIEVRIEEHPAQDFPQSRPHYE